MNGTVFEGGEKKEKKKKVADNKVCFGFLYISHSKKKFSER